MPRVLKPAVSVIMLAGAVACYRLPLHIRENDATGYEDVGIPTIEAVEYTPNGRDLRVLMEAPGYVTVIIVDPDRGATVRFKRGELRSQFAEKGVHRYPLDRLASPMMLSMMAPMRGAGGPQSTGRTVVRANAVRPPGIGGIALFDRSAASADSARRELLLSSRGVTSSSGAVKSAHVVVLVTESPLDLVGVATRLARGSLDPALVAQAAADVVEGGRWMAAVAPLRGQ
ncbi:MAG: hypothetical protein H7099_15015 [Gemmatimonadaceae bacterium]|nr:hypothetical protein [Gemmatimonadaceae bacterium]